jgi:hypothetical protein
VAVGLVHNFFDGRDIGSSRNSDLRFFHRCSPISGSVAV